MTYPTSQLSEVQIQAFNLIEKCINYKAVDTVKHLSNHAFGDTTIAINETELRKILNGNFSVSFIIENNKLQMILSIKKDDAMDFLYRSNHNEDHVYESEEILCKIDVGVYIINILKTRYGLKKDIKIKSINNVQKSFVFTLTRKLF